MSFDEEELDPHGECAHEIASLRARLAAAEKALADERAERISALTPDPLLPGLRAARYLLQEWRDQGATSPELYQKITAEIARREGG